MQTFERHETPTARELQKQMRANKTALGWAITFAVFVPVAALIVFATLEKTKQPFGVDLVKQSSSGVGIGTLTSFTDSNTNTWNFAMNTASVLQYTWKRPEFNPKVVWDSVNGSCGPNQSNFVSMSNSPSVSTRTQGITLAQTPMFLDANGVQRTFRLQLYNADVRIESTNGDGRFWSIVGGNVFAPQAWPSSIPSGLNPLWQSASPPNFAFYAQFLTNGNLLVQQPNGGFATFVASTWSNPVC